MTITTEPAQSVCPTDKDGLELGSIATAWDVEGTGRETKIRAFCPACRTAATFHDDVPESGRLFSLPFTHHGCLKRVEPIPSEIQGQYLQRALAPTR